MVKGKFGKTSKVSKYYEDDCSFKPNFGPFWSKFGLQKFFFVVSTLLNIVVSYHCIQFQGKLINQTRKNDKKASFRSNFVLFLQIFDPQKSFLWFLPLPDVIHCYQLSLYAISRKTKEPNLRKWQKKLISGPILVCFCKIWFPKIFSVVFTPTRCYNLL